MLQQRINVGDRIPAIPLGELIDGELRSVSPQVELAQRRVIIIGVPGAFTAVCSRLHLPGFVEAVPALRRSGFDQVICITPDSPWTVEAWSKQIDPLSRLRFLSDGNLAFGRALGLTTRLDDVFMGECYQRFVLVAESGYVRRVQVETDPLEVTCTAAARLGEPLLD